MQDDEDTAYLDSPDSPDSPNSSGSPHSSGPAGLTHPLKVGYLVVGLVLLGVAGIWALGTAGVLDSGDLGWLLPALLMAAGTVGLVASVVRERTRLRPTSPLSSDDDEER